MTRRILLIIVSAGIFALCFPDGPLPPAAFVCLAPFALALHNAGAGAGLLLGVLCGFSFWMVAAWWLANGFYFYVRLPWPAAWFWTIVACLISSLPYALFGLLNGYFAWMKTPFGRLKGAAALTVLLSWYPLAFPGNYVHSLYSVIPVIQVADLGGVPLLLFLTNLVNFYAAGAILDPVKPPGPVKNVLIAAGILALIIGYGTFRLQGLRRDMTAADESRLVRIVSIQPNLSLRRAGAYQVFGNSSTPNDIASVLTLSEQATHCFPEAQAVAWPELPCGIPCRSDGGFWQSARDLAESSGIPFIVNCYEYDPTAGGDYNIARLISGDEESGPAYKKRILLPFGEYLPGERRLPWLRRIFPRSLHYIPGDDIVTLLPLDGNRQAIPTLCYEVLFPGLVREFVRQGGDVIVNLVDDVWFGDSDASAVHMALAVFRTVESRVPLVRVTNSGNGVFVQPTGEIVKGSRTPVFEPRVSSFPLFVPDERSVYARYGDVFLIFLTVVWFGETVVRYLRKRCPWFWHHCST